MPRIQFESILAFRPRVVNYRLQNRQFYKNSKMPFVAGCCAAWMREKSKKTRNLISLGGRPLRGLVSLLQTSHFRAARVKLIANLNCYVNFTYRENNWVEIGSVRLSKAVFRDFADEGEEFLVCKLKELVGPFLREAVRGVPGTRLA